MTVCNFCNKRESRSCTFEEPYTCNECCRNKDNYAKVDDNIIFIDSSNKKIQITSETELDIVNTYSTANNSIDSNDNEIKSLIDTENFKDALLASLYSQVEFLGTQIEEKDLLIRTLIIKESDIYNYESSRNIEADNSVTSLRQETNINVNGDNNSDSVKTRSCNNSNDGTIDLDETGDDINDESFFKRLYIEYVQSRNEELDRQLKDVREQKHNLFQGLKEESNPAKPIQTFGTNYHYNQREITNPNELWPPNTVLIGDSMINQIDEKRLSTSTKKTVKVRSFGGAGVKEIYPKLGSLLRKKPSNIILHVGTNDSVNKASETILDDLLKLKHHIEQKAPGICVILSCPISRTDNGKARLTILRLVKKIKFSNVNYLCNVNVGENCLGVKGLHLNPRGVGRFATNLISLIRGL